VGTPPGQSSLKVSRVSGGGRGRPLSTHRGGTKRGPPGAPGTARGGGLRNLKGFWEGWGEVLRGGEARRMCKFETNLPRNSASFKKTDFFSHSVKTRHTVEKSGARILPLLIPSWKISFPAPVQVRIHRSSHVLVRVGGVGARGGTASKIVSKDPPFFCVSGGGGGPWGSSPQV